METNFFEMVRLFDIFPYFEIFQTLSGKLYWSHIVTLLYVINSKIERHYYIHETMMNGWSRNVLSMHIETNLFKRQSHAVTNFKETLPITQSDLAQEFYEELCPDANCEDIDFTVDSQLFEPKKILKENDCISLGILKKIVSYRGLQRVVFYYLRKINEQYFHALGFKRGFFHEYSDFEFVQHVAAQFSNSHHARNVL